MGSKPRPGCGIQTDHQAAAQCAQWDSPGSPGRPRRWSSRGGRPSSSSCPCNRATAAGAGRPRCARSSRRAMLPTRSAPALRAPGGLLARGHHLLLQASRPARSSRASSCKAGGARRPGTADWRSAPGGLPQLCQALPGLLGRPRTAPRPGPRLSRAWPSSAAAARCCSPVAVAATSCSRSASSSRLSSSRGPPPVGPVLPAGPGPLLGQQPASPASAQPGRGRLPAPGDGSPGPEVPVACSRGGPAGLCPHL